MVKYKTKINDKHFFLCLIALQKCTTLAELLSKIVFHIKTLLLNVYILINPQLPKLELMITPKLYHQFNNVQLRNENMDKGFHFKHPKCCRFTGSFFLI